jgi:hypothetical protein
MVMVAPGAVGDVVVDYTMDLGGNNPYGPSGLAAQASFALDGTQLTIELRNTSTALPMDAEVADALLVSLGFNLTDGVSIMSGDAAVIADDGFGLGTWADRGPGDSVAEEWLWSNDFGGDLLGSMRQLVSTSEGFGGGDAWDFLGMAPAVDGPFGGIAAYPTLIDVPGTQPAVAKAIRFELTLTRALTMDELSAVANDSMVEFGSDFQYLGVPAPGAIGLLALAGLTGAVGRRRRS